MEAIKVEHIYKQYRLGQVNTGTLSHDLNRWWSKLIGKEDPYQKITETNDRTSRQGSDYVWALEDINFSVPHGEVFGIIGKNGAGKSTLLKLLSKVTSPSKGTITLHGRVASLLEVGTGFHPELTGRENIFLNGAILGMTKAEIRAKFDEIVAFSGVEKYIDTPVKRYSSGMYVRLAFAVAAHLEPEILIIDEVLAVGDAEFQKKCLGKMKEVSGQGRTVIFVSHNLAAVKALCQKGILLQHGKLISCGSSEEILSKYINSSNEGIKPRVDFLTSDEAIGNQIIRIKTVEISPTHTYIDEEIRLKFSFWNLQSEHEVFLAFDLLDVQEQVVFGSAHMISPNHEGVYSADCIIPANLMNNGRYSINLYFHTSSMAPLYQIQSIITFEILENIRTFNYFGKINGAVRPKLEWE